MTSDEQDNRTLGGYKATLHNANAGEAAKEHAAKVLSANGETLSAEDSQYLPDQPAAHHGQQHHAAHESGGYHDAPVKNKDEASEHGRQVLGGYKATLANPNTSEEAKQHAGEVLAEHGYKI